MSFLDRRLARAPHGSIRGSRAGPPRCELLAARSDEASCDVTWLDQVWLSLIGQLQLLYSAAVRPARSHEWGTAPLPCDRRCRQRPAERSTTTTATRATIAGINRHELEVLRQAGGQSGQHDRVSGKTASAASRCAHEGVAMAVPVVSHEQPPGATTRPAAHYSSLSSDP
jgi:hypothetical protein